MDRRISSLLAALVALEGCSGCPEHVPEPVDEEIEPSEADLEAALDADGELTAEGCVALCQAYAAEAGEVMGCSFGPGTDAEADGVVVCEVDVAPRCIGGRHHVAVGARQAGRAVDPVARYLAQAALDEATSVKAFVSLGIELRRLGAPEALIAGARAAALDEVAHARLLGGLARARGADSGRAELRPTPDRGLLALAVENAVEGCVNETWAALVAHWQAAHAENAALGRASARIARDEARHAELAWAIDAWAAEELDAAEYEAVVAARAEAVRRLAASLGEPDPATARAVGLPSATDARRLLRALDEQLWAAAC